MNNKEQQSQISKLNLFARLTLSAGLDIFFPSKVEQVTTGLTKAENMLNNGYGLVIVIPHFSLRDAPEVLKSIIFKSKVMRKRKVIAPIALHQYKPVIGTAARTFGISLHPIVTKDTVDLQIPGTPNEGQGMDQYISNGIKVLSNSGILLVAPQTGRRDHLVQPEKPTLATFVTQARRKHLNSFGFLFVGLGIKGETIYQREKTGRLNLGRTYEIKVGPAFTIEEALAKVNHNIRSLDLWAYNQLRPLVPESYRSL